MMPAASTLAVAPSAGHSGPGAVVDSWADLGRRLWWLATFGVTVSVTGALIVLALGGATNTSGGLQTIVVFLGGDVHVAATGFFYTLRPARAYFREHLLRYWVVPAGLIVGGALLAVALPASLFAYFLIAHGIWQWWHYQKQNLGMVALSGVAFRAGSLTAAERQTILLAGTFGILGVVHKVGWFQDSALGPLLPGLHVLARLGFVVCLGWAVVNVVRRERKPWRWTLMYAMAVGFFAPVFIFENLLAAVVSIAVAHGYQYLVIMGALAGSRGHERRRPVSLFLLLTLALVGALVALPLHDLRFGHGLPGRALFGAYSGFVAAHFVIDAGIWRMRDPWPRSFMRTHLRFLFD